MASDDAATAPDAAAVGKHTRRGISWNLVGALLTNAMRLVVVVVLGRVLDSHDFGVVAAAISVLQILQAVRDIGIGPALIQRQQLDPAHTSTAFAVSSYLGLGFAAIVVGLAPMIGELYRIPDSVAVLRALGCIFALRGLQTTSQMLCQRAMNFRAVALIDTGSYCAGSIVSMSLAISGMGPWALVVGYLVEEAISTAVFLVLYPPPFAVRVDHARLRDLLGYGAGQTVTQIAGVLATQGDNIVVGHQLGATELGFYTRAYDLIKMPALVFTNIVGNVLFPAFSRLQGEPERLGVAFRRVIFATALIVLPASALLIAIAPEAIHILMGPSWSEAVLPFRILAITMLMRVSYKVGAMVASAAGHVWAVAFANVLYAVFVIGGAALTIRWGIAGVAVSTAASLLFVYLACSWLGMVQCGLGWRGFGAAHAPGLALGAVVTTIAWPLAEALRSAGQSFVVTFVAITAVGGTVTLTGVVWWLRRGRGDFAWLREELAAVRARLSRRRARAQGTASK